MASVTSIHPSTAIGAEVPRKRGGIMSAFAPLSSRRFALTVRTPRELFVPLLTPILFALVIAPALKKAFQAGADYESFVAIGSVGVLIPLNMMFAGISAIIDRESG